MSVQEIKTAVAGMSVKELQELADFIAVQLEAAPEMDEDAFWHIIEQLDWSKEGKNEAVLAPAVTALSLHSEAAIKAFAERQAFLLFQLDGKAYADAFAKKDGYLSADEFLYARCAVIANGRETYYRILAHPKQMPDDLSFEDLLYLPELAWELRTGKPWDYLPACNYETGFNVQGWGNAAIKL